MTEENTINTGISAKFTVTLETPSRLHLYYWASADDTAKVGINVSVSGWSDIVLRKVR